MASKKGSRRICVKRGVLHNAYTYGRGFGADEKGWIAMLVGQARELVNM